MWRGLDSDSLKAQDEVCHFAGRTDAGVHALCNTAHVDIVRRMRNSTQVNPEPFTLSELTSGINFHLLKQGHQCAVTSVRSC
jgi:tRNA U38,U39,U40 pseudouridine synthase TruA